VCESVFTRSPGVDSDAERSAAGAPNIPDRGGVPEGGARPPCLDRAEAEVALRELGLATR